MNAKTLAVISCGSQLNPLPPLLALLLLVPSEAGVGGTVTNCTEADFLAAATDGGTVTFACDGTITLRQTFTNTVDTLLDATGHQVTLSGNAIRLFVVNSNVTFSVRNLTIAQGRAQTGAGILCLGGNIVLNGATVGQNTAIRPSLVWESFLAGRGGGIYLAGGTLSATNSTFSENRATVPFAVGGAIKNDGGVVSLQACVFTGNSASGVWDSPPPGSPGLPAYGGAIDNEGTLVADSCVFLSNYAYGGFSPSPGAGGSAFGGAINNSGRAEINRCSFANNSASGGNGAPGFDATYGTGQSGGPGGGAGSASGGAVCNGGLAYVAASTFTSNSLTGGYGGRGGNGTTWMDIGTSGGPGGGGGNARGSALFNSGTLGLVNCTITAGSASGGAGGNGGAGGSGPRGSGSRGSGGVGGAGGGAVGDAAGLEGLTNCTVALNLATYGAGGSGAPAGTNGAAAGGLVASGATLINCLLASNALGNCAGHLNDAGHNLSSDATCAFTNTGSLNAIDPDLAPLAANGGPTLTMALLPGSPAIDAGDAAAAPPTDQRGFVRPAGLAADIGAYEYGLALSLRASLDPGGDMVIRADGPPGQTCRLFLSADLDHWFPAATNQLSIEGTALFYQSRGLAWCFYRAVTP